VRIRDDDDREFVEERFELMLGQDFYRVAEPEAGEERGNLGDVRALEARP
jgi:hypothetical protein